MNKITIGIFIPLIFWLISSVLLIFLLPGELAAFAIGYAMLLPVFLLTWWSIAFARWLRSKFGWENVAYLLSNLSLGFLPVGVGTAIAMAMAAARVANELSTLVFLFGGVLGVGWLLGSIWRRIREGRHKQYHTLFWRPLESGLWIWRFWQQAPMRRQTRPITVEKTPTNLPPTTKAASNPLFRRVPPSPDLTEPLDRSIVIPPRDPSSSQVETKAASPSGKLRQMQDIRTPQLTITITTDSEQANFVSQAKRLAARTESHAEPVPFSQYWPTYAHMSPEQQRWYFYWRTAVQSGHFLPTDLSYLFVYVYECINLVGFATAQAAFDRLVLFWQHYRVLQPKLDHYLIDWLADFLVVHRLPMLPLSWYGQAVNGQGTSGDVDLLLEGWLHTGGDCRLLPGQLLYQFAVYSPEHSKFYQAYRRQHNLDAAYQKGLHAVDCYLQQSAGISLFMSYMPQTTRLIQRPPFAGALHGYGQTSITIGQVRPWQAQESLTRRLKSILKQTENVLREQLQFKTKLRGIDLPLEWIAAIEQAMITPTAKRTVDIDFASVTLLKRDSEEIRRRLTVEDDAVPVISNEVQSEPVQGSQQSQNGASPVYTASSVTTTAYQPLTATDPAEHTDNKLVSYTQRPADTPVGLLTDLAEIAAIMGGRSNTAAQLLVGLRNHNWQAPPAKLNDEQQGGFLNVLFDQINERAIAHLGDALVFDEGGMWVVAEDYRDEITYILDHPAYIMMDADKENDLSTVDVVPLTDLVANDNTPIVRTELDRKQEQPIEWVHLSKQFQEQHWATLAVLLQGVDVDAQVHDIARHVHSTANQLIDQINEFSLDSIGDILIITQGGTLALEDEHLESLRRLYIVSGRFNSALPLLEKIS